MILNSSWKCKQDGPTTKTRTRRLSNRASMVSSADRGLTPEGLFENRQVGELVQQERTRHRNLTNTSTASSILGASREEFTQEHVFVSSPHLNNEAVPAYILHPESHLKTGWDIFTGIQVVIISFFLPFEICFIDSQNLDSPTWWLYIEQAMTYAFMLDLLVNFFTAYRAQKNANSSLISDPRKIAIRYTRTWLIPDFVAAFPYDLLFERGNQLGKLGRFSRFAKLIRLARLFRLVKLHRVFRLVQNLERRINIHPGLSRMNRILISVIFGVHMACCVWFVIGKSIHYQDFPDPWPDSSLHGQQGSWISQFGYAFGNHLNQTFSLERQYVASFYYCMTTLTTVGYGDISGKTYAEQLFGMGLMIFGVLWYSFVLSSTASIIQSFLGEGHKIHTRLREVNQFLTDANIDENLAARIRNHFHILTRKNGVSSFVQEYDVKEVLRGLSNELKTEVIIEMQRRILSKIPYLNGKSRMFQASLLVHLESSIIGTNDLIIQEGVLCNKLQFLTKGRGVATIEQKYLGIFEEGDCIGQSGLLTSGIQLISVSAFIPCYIEALPFQVLTNLARFYALEVDELMGSAAEEVKCVEYFKKVPIGVQSEISKAHSMKNVRENPNSTTIFSRYPSQKVSTSFQLLATKGTKPEDIGMESDNNCTPMCLQPRKTKPLSKELFRLIDAMTAERAQSLVRLVEEKISQRLQTIWKE